MLQKLDWTLSPYPPPYQPVSFLRWWYQNLYTSFWLHWPNPTLHADTANQALLANRAKNTYLPHFVLSIYFLSDFNIGGMEILKCFRIQPEMWIDQKYYVNFSIILEYSFNTMCTKSLRSVSWWFVVIGWFFLKKSEWKFCSWEFK